MPALVSEVPFLSICAFARITMPGMQKPHCSPPHAANASEKHCRSASSTPSSVTTDFPLGLGDVVLTRHGRLPVDQHGATAALTRRRTAVLRRRDVELLAERGEEVRMARPHGDRSAVHLEPDPPAQPVSEAGVVHVDLGCRRVDDLGHA